MRILIVDDSEILIGRLIENLSEIDGIEVVGQERDLTNVINTIDLLKPDIIILDICMPGGNGILLLETIKKKKEAPKVLMFTNYPYLQYRKRCMDAGADFFFYKSTEFEKLVEVIRKLVLTSQK